MNPIAWREAKTKGSANRAIIIRYGFMLIGIGAAVTLLVLNSTYPSYSAVIANNWNPQDKTLSIYKNGKTTVYRVNPNAINITFIGADNKNVVVNEKIAPDDLRPDMVVDENNLTIQNQTISSLTVSYPKPSLDTNTTRQFLLYFMLIELAIIMLILTQNAASTVTREKEDGALDILLATPITSRYYIWGKLRGLVSFVIPLLAVPILSILLFVVWDSMKKTPWAFKPAPWTVLPESLFVLPASLIISAAFAAILGMRMSLQCKKTIVAVMFSLGIVGAVFGLFWVCGFNFASSKDLQEPGVCIGCFSPFTLMALCVTPLDIVNQSIAAGKDLSSLRFLIFLFGWIASAIYAVIVWTMYKSMVYNFDMTIRKQNS
jgi:ABC-type Na+ efflux pump permease subunit